MTVIPGGFVISRPLRVADYYNYEVEIRFPVNPTLRLTTHWRVRPIYDLYHM